MEDNKNVKLIGAFVVICVVIAIIITVSQLNSQPLQGYVEESTNMILTTVAPYAPETTNPNMQLITDNSVGLSLLVPQEWTKVIKNGNVMFVHQDSASYVSVEKSAYVPNVLSVSSESLQSDLAAAGANFISFQPDGNFGYTLLYQSEDNGTLFNKIEITRVDLQNVVKINICVPSPAYKKFEKEVDEIAKSVVWEPKYPIPENYILAYNNFGNFEFAVPAAWSRGIENNEYVARDPNTGAEMHVSVAESNALYTGMNQAIYADYLASGKEGFSIKQFTCTDNLIYCVSTYTVNTYPVYRVEYLLATGAYEYTICFICPTAYYQEIAPMFDEAFSLFRTF